MKIKIECLSDTCIGGGKGYGTQVDTDIEHDEHGIPYIPSKRLKGLLKEAAREILEDFNSDLTQEKIDEIFGNEGFVEGDLVIRDAYVENYDKLVQQLKAYDDAHNKEDLRQYRLSNERIFDHYTYVRAQTAIDEDGIAKDQSLRFIRVVKKGTIFEAHFELNNHKKEFANICKMVRHMGMNRTRGFGWVKCSVEESERDSKTFKHQFNDDELVELKCIFRNNTDLLMADQISDESNYYIKGSSIYGFIANQYAKLHQTEEGFQDRFNELFIYNKKLHFSDAHVSLNQEETMLAPYSLYKFKDCSYYVNVARSSEGHEPFVVVNGQEVKQKSMVRNKTISASLDKVKLHPIRYNVNYHHQRPKDRKIGHVLEKEDGGAFYQYKVIAKGQRFVSTICGKGKDLNLIIDLFNKNNHLRVGKSKNSQYGDLELIDIIVQEKKTVKANAFALLLRSHALIRNKDLTNDTLSMVQNIAKAVDPRLTLSDKSYYQFVTVGGFNGKWKLPLEQRIALKAGTLLMCESEVELELAKRIYVGDRQVEGFGEVLVFKADEIKEYPDTLDLEVDHTIEQTSYEDINPIIKECAKDLIKAEANKLGLEHAKNAKDLQATQINKALSMLRKATSFDKFEEEVNLISDPNKKEKIKKYLAPVFQKSEPNHILKLADSLEEKMNITWTSFEKDEFNKIYAETLLICVKIKKRGED